MLGSASPATASVCTATTSATPSSPTRPSRLRGLSYLRNYTNNHRHSSSQRVDAPPLTRSTSSPIDSATAWYNQQSSERPQPPASSTIQSGENGWIPTIQGRSGLSRESLHPTSTSIESACPEPNSAIGMTRSRAASAFGPTPSQRQSSVAEGSSAGEQTAMPDAKPSASGPTKEHVPTIRFIPHIEARSSRPSLHFTTVSRTLKTPDTIVRVGRYSERDDKVSDPDLQVVGFKSKVVSRKHCEFWCTDGQWYIKDVRSSSGTFLNHVRLSSPGQESRPYPVNDGDVVQLGIDFKGGEEVIFRCVKIRVECNRSWQKTLNNFNTSAHKRLFRNTGKNKNRDSDTASVNSSECSICLNPVAPCQALFVAPCSHVWHYKCVRNLIHGPNYPNFLCPNCRAVADLDADVEPPEGEYFEDTVLHGEVEEMTQSLTTADNEHSSDDNGSSGADAAEEEPPRARDPARDTLQIFELADEMDRTSLAPLPVQRTPSSSSSHHEGNPTSQPMAIAQPTPSARKPSSASDLFSARSPTPTTTSPFALAVEGIADSGLLTPRNHAGPFVLDGSAGGSVRPERGVNGR